MSHFAVLVIGNSLEAKLAPFSEDLEVESREEDCYCLGNAAHHAAIIKVEKQIGTMDQLRQEFGNLYQGNGTTEQWRKFMKDLRYDELMEKYTKAHPQYRKPDKKCDQCNGTGKMTTTFNPDAKWDWYTIGGRWQGLLPVREEVVTLYRGTKRVDCATKADVDFEHEVERLYALYVDRANKHGGDPAIPAWRCTKCGTPINLPACDKCGPAYEGRRPNYGLMSTFAIIDDDGNWIEKGEMGWFGVSHGDMAESKWEDVFDKIVNELPNDTILTVVDCHI